MRGHSGEQETAQQLLGSLRMELFESLQLYSEGVLEWPWSSNWKMVLKWLSISDTGTLHCYCLGVLGH